jgi:hypothetical protein
VAAARVGFRLRLAGGHVRSLRRHRRESGWSGASRVRGEDAGEPERAGGGRGLGLW